MTSRHTRPTARPVAFALAGAGLAGMVALTGFAPDLLARVAAKTIIVVGGASDPTGRDQWSRIDGDYAGSPPVFVTYPAQFGVGWPGFALSGDQKTTYAQSLDEGADATVTAIETAKRDDPDEEVVVYTISEGADVVGLAVIRYGEDHPMPADGSAKLTFIEQGSPSFVRSGVWNVVPHGIPGLQDGPVLNDGASGATVVSICVKGDFACSMGSNPIPAVVYFVPGFDMHGKVYTAENIGKYSPADGEGFTPGATPETPVRTTTEVRNGNDVTVDHYQDGTIKRTWTEGNTTWVSIDKGENPWGWMLREYGVPVPTEFDRILNRLIPVTDPGDTGFPAVSDIFPATTIPATTPVASLIEASDSDKPGKHRADDADLVPVAQFIAPVTEEPDEPETPAKPRVEAAMPEKTPEPAATPESTETPEEATTPETTTPESVTPEDTTGATTAADSVTSTDMAPKPEPEPAAA